MYALLPNYVSIYKHTKHHGSQLAKYAQSTSPTAYRWHQLYVVLIIKHDLHISNFFVLLAVCNRVRGFRAMASVFQAWSRLVVEMVTLGLQLQHKRVVIYV